MKKFIPPYCASFICICGHRCVHHKDQSPIWARGDCEECDCKQYRDSGIPSVDKIVARLEKTKGSE